MPSFSNQRPSLPNVHTTLTQLGYRLVAQNGDMRCYQHQDHQEVALFLDFGTLATLEDLSRALTQNGENVDAFFAMYESI